MKKIFLFFLIVTFFLSPAKSLDSFDIYEILYSSTIRINIWQDHDSEDAYTISGGSGVIINEINGVYFILTNAHVVLEKYCHFEEETNCKDKGWDDWITIAVDTPDTKFDYIVSYDDIMYWAEYDFAVIRLDMNNYITDDQFHDFKPIKIGGYWHPLMNVYGSGFPYILGNYYKNYAQMVYCSGIVHTMFMDDDSLYQLGNYSIAHSCTLAGGMSGGPLLDEEGMLLGVNGLSGNSQLYSDWLGNLVDIDIAPARFDYAMDIWDLYRLELISNEDEEGHFNSNSSFYGYLPKLSYDFHNNFYESYVDLFPNKIDKINSLFE